MNWGCVEGGLKLSSRIMFNNVVQQCINQFNHLHLSNIFIFFNVVSQMGACLTSACYQEDIHPFLGTVQDGQLFDRKIIKIVDFSLTQLKLKQWQNRMRETKEKNPRLCELIFIPIHHQVASSCSLNVGIEFYFQNFRQNLAMQKLEKDRKGIRYKEERIKQIGQVLFELLETNPQIDEELTLENIMLNDDGKIKIALKKYLPQLQCLQVNSYFGGSRKTKWSEDTDYSSSPRLSLGNVEFRKINLLSSICRLMLSLVKDGGEYSSSFIRIMGELGKLEKNVQVLNDYFLRRGERNPRNYFLDIPYMEAVNEKSNDTSLFLITESGWTDAHNL